MEPTTVEVQNNSGRVRGLLLKSGADSDDSCPVAEFRGLSYAARPALWEAPRPVRIRDAPGVLDFTGLAPVPPQPRVAENETGPGSYLTLTVRTPWPLDRPRPVLVWLCVGGNIVGRTDAAPFTTSTIASSGVVLVTVAARLGPAGFAPVDDAPDNRAVLDWIAALEWVRDEIAAFGGDPHTVTIGGQSAGGGAVTALLASTRAGGLFHRAIIMSSATPSTAREPAARATAAFAKRLGVAPTAAALSRVPYDRLIGEVADTFGPRWRVDDPVIRVRHMREGPPFRIVDDAALNLGPVLPALKTGTGAGVPVLIGSTTEEFTDAFGPLSDRLHGDALARAFDEIAPGAATSIRWYRDRMPASSAGQILGQAFTDATFRTTPVRVAAARSAATAPTFLYETGPFAAGPSAAHSVDVAAALGSAHTNDLPSAIAHQLASAWSQFVLTGSPGWDPWCDGHRVHRFATGASASAQDAGADLDEIAGVWAGR
jgi:para-nitrobenzyl esterase